VGPATVAVRGSVGRPGLLFGGGGPSPAGRTIAPTIAVARNTIAPTVSAAAKPELTVAGRTTEAGPVAWGAATVPSTARPSAPPSCRVVLSSPLARPPRSGPTPEVAAIMIGADISPPPSMAMLAGMITQTTAVSAEKRPSHPSPTAAMTPPAANSARASSADTSLKLVCDPAITAIDIGSKRRPASSGELWRRLCRYRVRKNQVAITGTKLRKLVRLPAESARERNTANGTSGLLASRVSMSANVASSAAAAASPPST